MKKPHEPNWNLYAHFTGARCDNIIMPDEYGALAPTGPAGDNWYAVAWPVNPHFTGRGGVMEILTEHYPHKEAC
ncbi:MAG: hypothetical protein U9Q07_02325 [Planctomycetota bacterium]|nr:hypothetical protein [Planctomycetota bacterium]